LWNQIVDFFFGLHHKTAIFYSWIRGIEEKNRFCLDGIIRPKKINWNINNLERPIFPMGNFMKK
jgi:hypothetical protein